MRIKLVGLIVMIGMTFSCVNEFPLENKQYDRLIVVDGVVTDEAKNHTVSLTYTAPINSSDDNSVLPVQGAEVYVVDSDGNTFPYAENTSGHYVSVDVFAGVAGKSYQLKFTLSDGSEYQSAETVLIKSPSITSIYPDFTRKLISDLNEDAPGVQFYLNSKPDTQEQVYFRYEWEETVKLKTPFISLFGYDKDTGEAFRRTETDVNVNECYITSESERLILATTTTNANNQLNEIPINFVPTKSDKIIADQLRNRYSIQVTQYAISAEDYNYYQRIKKLDDDTGTLFDQQLGSVNGNIVNRGDDKEVVLGNFEVAGVSKKRNFFDPDDYGDSFDSPKYRYSCDEDNMVISSPDSLSYYMDKGGYQIITKEAVPVNQTVYRLGILRCTDCTWFADSKKPDFWIDE